MVRSFQAAATSMPKEKWTIGWFGKRWPIGWGVRLKLGATDHNVRLAIQAGLAPEIAIQMVTINPARHMRLTPWVGSIAPGRFADVVLLEDLETVGVRKVWADGDLVGGVDVVVLGDGGVGPENQL